MKLKPSDKYPSAFFATNPTYPIGTVLQWYDGAWHSIYVVVKSNERFVWIKTWENKNNKDVKPVRKLKHKLREEGYSFEPCGYSSDGCEYIGKVINL